MWKLGYSFNVLPWHHRSMEEDFAAMDPRGWQKKAPGLEDQLIARITKSNRQSCERITHVQQKEHCHNYFGTVTSLHWPSRFPCMNPVKRDQREPSKCLLCKTFFGRGILYLPAHLEISRLYWLRAERQRWRTRTCTIRFSQRYSLLFTCIHWDSPNPHLDVCDCSLWRDWHLWE